MGLFHFKTPMADLKTQIVVGANSEGVATGLEAGKRSLKDFAATATAAGKDAGKGIASVGEGGEFAARKVDSSTRSMIGSIQRLTAATDAGDKTSRQYQESLARMRGIDVNSLKPYLDQLDQAKAKAQAAAGANSAFGSSFGGISASSMAATAAVGAVGAAFSAAFSLASIKNVINVADQFSKLAQKSGVAVESLRELNYAASLSDVSTESLGTGLRKLSQNMAAAAGGGKEQSAAFAAIGINVQNMDGSLKGADQTLKEVASKFASFKDSPEKAALAIELFGKAGADLIPLLNSGSTGLSDMAQEANALGIVFGADLAKNAEAFNDNLTRIQASSEGVKVAITAELLPMLNLLAQAFVDAKKEGTGFGSYIGVGLRTVLESAVILYSDVEFVLKGIGREIGGIAAKVVALGTLDIRGFRAISDAVSEDSIRARKTLDKFQYDLLNAGILTSQAGGGRGTAADPRSLGDSRTAAPIVAKVTDGAIKERIDENATLIASVRASMAATQAEYELGQKLMPAQKEIATLYEKISTSKKQYSVNTLLTVDALTKEWLAHEQGNLLREAGRKATEESNKERQKSIDAITKDTAALEDQIRKQQDQNAGIGQTKEAIAGLTAQRELDKASTLEAIAIKELDRSLDYQKYDATMAQVKAMRLLAGEQARGGVLQTMDETAKAAQAEWTKFYDSVYNGLTDSLFRAFEKGGSFFRNFWDGIRNLFKTTVLKLAIQGVVGGVASLLGMSGAANAATGGNSILSGLSNLSTLNSIGSVIGTGFAGTVGASVGALFGTMAGNTATGMALGLGSGSSIAAASAASVAGGGAAAGAGLTSVASTLGAIPGVGWAALAAVAVASIFGGRGNKEVTGSGIEGNVGGDGFSGNSFSTWKQSGGWFHNDSSGKETGTLDAATTDQFSNSYKAVRSAAMQAATALGLSATVIANYSERISLQLGSDAAANEKAVVALFSNMGDRMASAVAPGLSAMSRQGETAGATLSRLAGSLSAANAWLGMLGHTLLEVSLAGGNAASKLADAFGGIENMATASKSFYETYYTQAERSARSIEDMTKVLGALGLSLPASKDAFRALATGLDLTTDAGRKAYAAMLTLAPEFAATTDALGALSKQAAQAIEALFSKLSEGIRSAVERIAGERFAVAAGVQQINGPGTMSRDAILRGIAGTSLAAPGIGGLSAAQSALGQADAAVAAQVAAVAYAKTQTPSRAALDGAGGALGAAQNATRAAQSEVDRYRAYGNSNFNMFMSLAESGRDVRGSGANGNSAPWGSGESNAQTVVFALQAAQRNQQPVQAAYDTQLAAYSGAAALNASQVAAAQAKLSAATAEQVASVTAAKAAQQAYIASLQDFAIDATKSAAKLGTLREETLKYYDAQKQLADLMASSAAGLRAAVTTARNEQLDSAQNLAQQQSSFSSAYSMALATTGVAQTGYADKLTAALPGLSTALMDAASTREEWALATGTLFAQSEAIAKQLQANAPQNYAADSLLMLGQIDAALTVLDASSKSAEKIIADAVTAGSENTANGLRAVIAALTGKSVPAFALGGSFAGGLRIVGENGPELEATGPSRIFSASQTRSMLSGGGSTARLEALVERQGQQLEAMSFELRAIAGSTNKTARSLDRAMPDGDALATRATV